MPAHYTPIDPAQFSAIRPTLWYPAAMVARWLGCSVITIRRRAKAGQLQSKRHPLDSRKLLILGSSVLAIAGPLAADLPPPPKSETKAQRRARARRAIENIHRMSKL